MSALRGWRRMEVQGLVVLLLTTVTLAWSVSQTEELDDNVSTYDNSEKDSFALTSESEIENRKRRRQLSEFTYPDRGSDFITQPENELVTQTSRTHSQFRTEERPLKFDPTQKPHSTSRARGPRRNNNNRRTTKKPNNIAQNSRSEDKHDLDLPDDKVGLTNVIIELQDQLRESQNIQTVTRSILNIVEEKQQALEDDLSFLKNEISTLHRQQNKDHETISALKDLVSDNTWGVTSLVSSQEQLKKDVSELKLRQEVQNMSLWQLEEVVLVGVKHDNGMEDGIQRLQTELRQLKEWRELDHKSVKQLKDTVTERLAGRRNINLEHPETADHRRRHEVEHSNHIDQKSVEVDLDFEKLDRLAGDIQEKHAAVERSLHQLAHKEAKLKEDMEQFSHKFSMYDTELSRVYTMFYNLSFQMSSLENKMLQHQQSRYESNLADLQQSLMNFTHHIVTMEQSHSNTRNHINRTLPGNQQDITMFNTMVDNHQQRIELLEKFFHEQKSEQGRVNDILDTNLSRMNNSIVRFYKSFQDHHTESTDVFDFIDEKFKEFNSRIDTNDNRLMRVEVRVLNTSLEQCERTNRNMEQGKMVEELVQLTTGLRKKVDNHNNLIDRLDHGMSRVFEDFGKHNKMIDSVMTEIKDITDIIPQVSLITQEVDKFVQHLPQDCYEVSLTQRDPPSDSYLIHPEGSTSSSNTFCEFDGGDAWTVIQRRQDGTVSFAQSWDNYKYGFGSASGEFWIGNENLHYLTTQDDYLLRIDMWDLEDRMWWAEYQTFRVDEEGANYNLQLEGYRGNATDALRYSNDMPFSTLDNDNDHSSTHCARFYTSGWWYKHCHYGNLNGRYTVGVVWFNHDFDEWVQLKKTVMKIRRIERGVKSNKTKRVETEAEFNETTFEDYQST